MKHIDYIPKGVCSRCIHLTVTDDLRIESVSFDGGCNGNLQGISSLVRGMYTHEAISKLRGICCGGKSTSCPDQLCDALEAVSKL